MQKTSLFASLAVVLFSLIAGASAGPVSTVKTEDGKSLFCQYLSDVNGVGYQLNLPIAIAKQDRIEITLGLFGVQCSRNAENQFSFELRMINDPFQRWPMDSKPVTTHILAHHAILLAGDMKIVGKQSLENKLLQIVKFDLPVASLITKEQSRELNAGAEVLINLDYFNRARVEFHQGVHVEDGGEQDGGVFRLSFTLKKDPISQKLIASPIQIQ